MNEISAIWSDLSPQVQAAAIQATVTLLAAIFGFGTLIFQLRSQGRQSRESIAENERRKLKAQMYEDAVGVSRALADAAIDLSTQLRSMAMEVVIASQAAAVNLAFQMPAARFPALAASYSTFSENALRFIFLVEHRRFIDPRIIVFRTALSTVLHDTRDSMYSKFLFEVMPALPTENPNGGLFPYVPPEPPAADRIKKLSDAFISSLDDAISYTEDFLVELQNLLVGDLFKNSVPHRVPLDPARKVITLEQAAALENWFASSTAWGKEVARTEEETKKRFGSA